MAGRLSVLAAAAGLVFLLAGCGGGGGDEKLPAGASLVPSDTAVLVVADPSGRPLLERIPFVRGAPPGSFYLRRLGSQPVLVPERDGAERPTSTLREAKPFQEAMGVLPEDAAARLYANGPSLLRGLDRELQARGVPGGLVPALGRLDWVALAAEPAEGGFRLEGEASGKPDEEMETFEPTLPAELPAGAELVVSFSRPDHLLRALLDTAGSKVRQQLGLAQAALGLSLEGDVFPALSGEAGLLAYGDGSLALVTRLDPEGEQTVRTLLARLGKILELADLGALESLPGGVQHLTLKERDLELFGRVVSGKLVVATTRAALARAGSGRRLAEDPRYRAALERAELPEKVLGFAYEDRWIVYALPDAERFSLGGFAADGP